MVSNNSYGRSYGRGRGTDATKVAVLTAAAIVLLAGLGAAIHLSSSQSNARGPAAALPVDDGTIEVVVPVQNIPPGATLEQSMFHRVRKPEIIVGPDIIRDFEEIKGLYSRGMLVSQQPVHRDFLTSLQPVNALTASIPKGYRAIAIAVDATSSVEGWAQPGARVDVIWVTKETGDQMAYVVAPNAKVLSANKKAEGARTEDKTKDSEVPTTVTLLLSVRDAMRVRLAALNGRLALVLRGMDADTVRPSGPISENALFNLGNRPASPARPIVDVRVKDPVTGKVENLKFEHGQLVTE